MIRSLQSLRGIFAIFIFFHHYRYMGSSLFPAGGDCGVAFFFILSGFVMSAGYSRRIEAGQIPYGKYFLKRLCRLYPLHLLCFLWALALCCTSFTLGDLPAWGANLLLLQSWIPEEFYFFSGNAVSWCLSDLLFFYAAFPLLTKLHNRRPAIFNLTVLTVAIVWAFAAALIPRQLSDGIIYINPATRIIDFSIGICLWHIHSQRQSVNSRRQQSAFTSNVMEISAIALLIAAIAAYPILPDYLKLSIVWWIPLSLVVLAFSTSGGGIVSHVLNQKWLIGFGNISFSFYMVHLLGITSVNMLIDKLGIADSFAFNLSAILITDIILALMINRCYEKPAESFLNRLLNRNRQKGITAASLTTTADTGK